MGFYLDLQPKLNKLTVDTKADYLLISEIFDKLFVDNEFFGLEQVLEFLKDNHF